MLFFCNKSLCNCCIFYFSFSVSVWVMRAKWCFGPNENGPSQFLEQLCDLGALFL